MGAESQILGWLPSDGRHSRLSRLWVPRLELLFLVWVPMWQCTGLLMALCLGVLPVRIGGPYRVPDIEPQLAIYKVRALPAVLW